MFAPGEIFHQSLIFLKKTGAYSVPLNRFAMEPRLEVVFHLGRLQLYPRNIRLGKKSLSVPFLFCHHIHPQLSVTFEDKAGGYQSVALYRDDFNCGYFYCTNLKDLLRTNTLAFLSLHVFPA